MQSYHYYLYVFFFTVSLPQPIAHALATCSTCFSRGIVAFSQGFKVSSEWGADAFDPAVRGNRIVTALHKLDHDREQVRRASPWLLLLTMLGEHPRRAFSPRAWEGEENILLFTALSANTTVTFSPSIQTFRMYGVRLSGCSCVATIPLFDRHRAVPPAIH